MNFVRFGLNLLRGRLTGEKIPLQLNMHVTDVCNLRCVYCYVDFDHAAADLSLADLKRVISEARACGTERVSIEGGEPLARRDIGDIVDHVRDLGMECNIDTNGYFIPRHIERLKRVSLFSVSLDGPPEVHDRLRGPGSFERAMKGIETAKAHGIAVHVLSVLTRHNRGHVDYLLDLAERTGFQWVPNSLFFMAGVKIDREKAAEYIIEDEDYKRLIGELIDKKARGRPIVWSSRTLKYVRAWPTTYFQSNLFGAFEDGGKFEPLSCQAARYFCVMQTNGDLYSCDPLLGYGPAANAVKLGFKEAFKRVSTHGCVACNSIVCSSYHQVFTMNVPVVLDLLAHYGKSARLRGDRVPRQ